MLNVQHSKSSSASCHLRGSLRIVLHTDVPVCLLLFKAANNIESLLELCSDLLLTGKKFQLPTRNWPKYLQGTPLTPMDISPQQNAEGPASAPTPPPQPHFTPQAAASPNPSFRFSFGASSSPDVPKQAGAKHTPTGRKAAAKSAADLPRSRFVPPNATDTSTGFSTAFGSSDQAQASSASTAAAGFGTAFGAPAQAQQNTAGTAGAAGLGTAFGVAAQAQQTTAGTAGAAGLGTAFGVAAQAQQSTSGAAGLGTAFGAAAQAQQSTSGAAGAAGLGTAFGAAAQPQQSTTGTAGAAGLGTAFGAPAQAQPSKAGTAGSGTAFGDTAQAQPSTAATAGAAGFGSAFGTTAQAQPSTAGTAGFAEQPAPRPAVPNGFATKPAATSGFSASGISAFTSAIPFSVPGRPMDSRISDACAMGLFGINLDSTAVQSATAQAAAAPAATAGASAATAGAHPVQQQPPGAAAVPGSYGTSSSFAAGSTEGGNGNRNQPSASCTAPAQQESFGSRGFSAAAAEGQLPTAGQAAQPSPYPFTMGAQTTPAHHSGRPLFGSEHLATNLHDKLVLEEQLAAATQAEAAQAAASYPKHFQPSAADPGPFSAAAAAAANGAAGPASTSSEAAQAQQQAAQLSAAGSSSAASAAAPTAAAPPPFIFGSSAASAANGACAAGRAAQGQPQGSSFGTAHSFPAQQAAAQPALSKPFVFGASASSSDASEAAAKQPRDGANVLPAGMSQAGRPQAAPYSTAFPAATSEVPLHFASGQVNTNGARSRLHSPSGVAKHTSSRGDVSGAGQHGRPVPGSPHARRTRPTFRKQPHPQVRA